MKTNVARAMTKGKHRALLSLLNKRMYEPLDVADLKAIVSTINKVIITKCEHKVKQP